MEGYTEVTPLSLSLSFSTSASLFPPLSLYLYIKYICYIHMYICGICALLCQPCLWGSHHQTGTALGSQGGSIKVALCDMDNSSRIVFLKRNPEG